MIELDRFQRLFVEDLAQCARLAAELFPGVEPDDLAEATFEIITRMPGEAHEVTPSEEMAEFCEELRTARAIATKSFGEKVGSSTVFLVHDILFGDEEDDEDEDEYEERRKEKRKKRRKKR